MEKVFRLAREPSLNAYLYFEAVARRGTVTLAAEELLVSPSAVSQQIKSLEQQLGVRLFRREGRALSLTLEGEQLFQASATALRMLRDARRNLGKSHEARRLNLRVSPSFGVRWLGPRLSDFVHQHPDWDLRIDAAPDPTDFDREIMDFDVRYGFGTWTSLHCTPILSDHVLPLCSPAYQESLMACGDPVAQLQKARLIDSARAMCQWDVWLMRNGIKAISNRKSILMDRSSMALQMALDGTGIVLESLALAAPEVEAGKLVPFMPDRPVVTFPAYWLVCPSRYLNRRAVRLFLTWIQTQATSHDELVAQILRKHGLSEDLIDAEEEFAQGKINTRGGDRLL